MRVTTDPLTGLMRTVEDAPAEDIQRKLQETRQALRKMISGYIQFHVDEFAAREATIPEATIPEPAGYGWVEWGGGDCPVPAHVLVMVGFRTRHKNEYPVAAGVYGWGHGGKGFDIVRYKVVS